MTAADIIVPAYNEAPRIGAVLDVVTRVPNASVLVVDDGSRDGTADIARARTGVRVLSLSPNRGKGGAMREALQHTSSPIVVFVDADLIGLRADHISSLIQPLLERPELGQVVGMRDWKGWVGEMQSAMPIISGERAVRRALLERMPPELWSGFKVEAGINDTVSRAGLKTGLVTFDGVGIVHKTQKFGVAAGLAKYLDMGREIVTAMTDARAAAARQHNPFGPPAPEGNPVAPAAPPPLSSVMKREFERQLHEGRLRSSGAAEQQPTVVEAQPAASVTAKCDSVECVADAIMGSAVKAAEPIVVDKVLPQVLADHRAIAVFGRSVGAGVADRLVSRLWVAVVALIAVTAIAAFLGSYFADRLRKSSPR